MDYIDLKNKIKKDLTEMLLEKREELRNLRFSASSHQLKQVHKIKEIKRDISRILTALKESK